MPLLDRFGTAGPSRHPRLAKHQLSVTALFPDGVRRHHGCMGSGARAPSSPPSSALPKRPNAVLRLFDSPVHRDWAFWMTIGWGFLAAASIPSSKEPSPLPTWLDTLIAIVVFIALFGIFPTWLRLLFRRWRRRRQQHEAEPPSTAPRAPTRSAGPAMARPPLPGGPTLSARRTPQLPITPATTPQTSPTDPDRIAHQEDGSQPPRTSQALMNARESLPHPVARAVRALQRAHAPKDQYEAMLEAAEILATTLTVTGAALLRGQIDGRVTGDSDQRDQAQRGLAALRNGLQRTTFGTWTNWLDQHLGPIADTQPDLIPGLRNALQDDGETPGILTDLRALQNERNRTSHGDKPRSPQESALRMVEFRPQLERALSKAAFLTGAPWLLTISCSYRPRPRAFEVVMQRVTGDHPDFECQSFTWAEPVANDTLYVLSSEGPLALAPLVASLLCDQCKQIEICYPSSVDRRTGPAVFKSFARGHEISAPELGDEIRMLPDCRPDDDSP